MARFTSKQFVEAYLEGGSNKEIAERLGTTEWTVMRLAKQMREKGVELPAKSGGTPTLVDEIDANELNEFIKAKKAE